MRRPRGCCRHHQIVPAPAVVEILLSVVQWWVSGQPASCGRWHRRMPEGGAPRWVRWKTRVRGSRRCRRHRGGRCCGRAWVLSRHTTHGDPQAIRRAISRRGFRGSLPATSFLRQVSTGVVIAFGEVGDHSVVDGTRECTPHGEHGQQFRRNANYFPHGCFAVFARGRSEFETESFAEQVLECDVIARADFLMVGENRLAIECFPRAILSLNLVRNQDLGVQGVYSRGLLVRTKTPPALWRVTTYSEAFGRGLHRQTK